MDNAREYNKRNRVSASVVITALRARSSDVVSNIPLQDFPVLLTLLNTEINVLHVAECTCLMCLV